MNINQHEIFRYLGYGKNTPTEEVLNVIRECEKEVEKIAECRYRIVRLPLFMNGVHIKIGSLEFDSENLSRNLKDCHEVLLFAATLGIEIDRKLSLYSRINVSKAAIFQATAAAAIEAFCNETQKAIESKMAEEGLFVRPRFSPGYGDVPLSIQKAFLSEINAVKTVGIALTDGNLMVPEKSVSAFMGLSKTNTRCHIEGCESCGKKDCLYKR